MRTSDEKKKLRRKAKLLYLDGMPIKKIMQTTGISYAELHHWAYQGSDGERPWKQIFDDQTKEMVNEVFGRTKRNIAKLWDVGTILIHNSLVARSNQKDANGNPIPLTLRESKTVSELLSNFAKLRMLETAQPTVEGEPERQAYVPISIDELKDAITKDNFTDLIALKPGADFKVVQHDQTNHANDGKTDARPSSGADASDRGEEFLHSETGRPDQDSSIECGASGETNDSEDRESESVRDPLSDY